MRMFPQHGESEQAFVRDWLRHIADALDRGEAWATRMEAVVDEHADPPTVTFTLRFDAPHLEYRTLPPEPTPPLEVQSPLMKLIGMSFWSGTDPETFAQLTDEEDKR